MTGEMLRLGVDLVILFCLPFAIYYLLKLSKAMSVFRLNKQEFLDMIVALDESIERAELALRGLKDGSRHAGVDVQKTLDESKTLAEELKIMNEVGESLAQRLEALAEKNSVGASPYEAYDFTDEEEQSEEEIRTLETLLKKGGSGFSIQDRDFESEEEGDLEDDLQSEAERELYEVLQGSRKNSGKRGA